MWTFGKVRLNEEQSIYTKVTIRLPIVSYGIRIKFQT